EIFQGVTKQALERPARREEDRATVEQIVRNIRERVGRIETKLGTEKRLAVTPCLIVAQAIVVGRGHRGQYTRRHLDQSLESCEALARHGKLRLPPFAYLTGTWKRQFRKLDIEWRKQIDVPSE